MSLYTTIHLHNVPADREAAYAEWFDGKHVEDLGRLRGFLSADRYEVTREQIMPDIPQPWRFMSVYEFDYAAPEIDLPALGPLLAEARDAGLIEPVLVGPERKINVAAEEAGIDLNGWATVPTEHSHEAAERACLLAAEGQVQALMKGALHTDELLHAVLANPKVRSARRLSHVFIFDDPDYHKLFMVTDGAINIAPTLARAFGAHVV